MAGDPKYLQLLEDMKNLHIKKNAGYSGDSTDRWANFRMSEAFGVSALKGCLVRMSDKFIRVQNLMKNPNNDQVGESIRDTLFDLSAYALIAICLLDEERIKAEPFRVYILPIMLTPDDWYDGMQGEVLYVKDLEDFGGKYFQCTGEKYKGNLIPKDHCKVFDV